MSNVVAIREGTHGPFARTAVVAQDTKTVWHNSPNWDILSAPQREALDQIASKVARVLCGNPNEADHALDIAGYASLMIKKSENITIAIGKSTVAYSPDTGEFIWLIAYRKPSFTSRNATHKVTNGYLYIKAGGKNHSASRTAWQAVHGTIPDGMEIDHINGDKVDNRIANLRLATRVQNLLNRTGFTRNQMGELGVSLHKQSGLFRARYKNATKYFDRIEPASEWYQEQIKAAKKANGLDHAGYAELGRTNGRTVD